MRVKTPNRIDLISPQFDSPGIFLCKAVNIYDTASYRKLPRHLYLTYTFIAHGYQSVFQFIHIQTAVIAEVEKLLSDAFQRCQKIHAAINAGDYSCSFSLQKCLDYFHSLTDQEISMNICLKKKKIPGRIITGIFVIEAIIFK